MVGTTSSGQPKNDTFIFEGETTDGIITKLNFDIIRNKGSEDEYSKKDIMGYLMNISDATVEKTEDGYRLATLSAYGYDPAYSDGDTYYAQYMLTASCENLTEDTVFADLSFSDLAQPGNVVTVEKACIAYGYLAREAGLELTAETLVKDLLTLHGLYADGAFVEGSNRVSFAGYNGGRSYGEQLEAITDYILANQMTLVDVYEMFRTVNQASTQIQDRDAIAGATITFGGDSSAWCIWPSTASCSKALSPPRKTRTEPRSPKWSLRVLAAKSRPMSPLTRTAGSPPSPCATPRRPTAWAAS